MYRTEVRLNDIIGVKLKHIAEDQSRSINEQINHIIKEYIKDYEKINGQIEYKKEEYTG